MSVGDIVNFLRMSMGVAHKADIAPILAHLKLGGGSAIPVGDDCAAIPDGDGFLLFAIEGFLPEFCAQDPLFAGYCGVMVNVSDVAAMGGRPVAVVDAVWSMGADHAGPMLSGLNYAAEKYGVPIIGGHTNVRAPSSMLSVAILGRAKKLLTSFDAKPGETLIAAIDLRGRLRAPSYWDASFDTPAHRLRGDLEILPEIAEAGLCAAAKDISMAGVLGTTLMLLEASHLGADIDLARIPRLEPFPLEHWLLGFPSYGFILSAAPQNADAIIGRFRARGIAAAAIGTANRSGRVQLRLDAEEATLWDFAEQKLVGCAPEAAAHA